MEAFRRALAYLGTSRSLNGFAGSQVVKSKRSDFLVAFAVAMSLSSSVKCLPEKNSTTIYLLSEYHSGYCVRLFASVRRTNIEMKFLGVLLSRSQISSGEILWCSSSISLCRILCSILLLSSGSIKCSDIMPSTSKVRMQPLLKT